MIGKTKAKIEILQERTVGNMMHIETDVNINGIIQRKSYMVPNGTSDEEIQKHISKTLVEEQSQSSVGNKFEVEI